MNSIFTFSVHASEHTYIFMTFLYFPCFVPQKCDTVVNPSKRALI